MAKIEIEVKATAFDGDEDGDVESQVISKVSDILVQRMTKEAQERIAKIVDAQVMDKLSALVTSVIEEGIHQTDNYGSKTGKVITVRGLIMDRLAAMLKPKDSSYERKAGEIERQIATMTDEAIKQFLAKEIVGELNGIKVKLKDTLTTAVLGNLQQQVSSVIAGR